MTINIPNQAICGCNKQDKINLVYPLPDVCLRCRKIVVNDYIKDFLSPEWVNIKDQLPEDEISVLCYHAHSGSYFICYRTKDCTTNEPKWQGGAMPTHWKLLDKPSSNDR